MLDEPLVLLLVLDDVLELPLVELAVLVDPPLVDVEVDPPLVEVEPPLVDVEPPLVDVELPPVDVELPPVVDVTPPVVEVTPPVELLVETEPLVVFSMNVITPCAASARSNSSEPSALSLE